MSKQLLSLFLDNLLSGVKRISDFELIPTKPAHRRIHPGINGGQESNKALKAHTTAGERDKHFPSQYHTAEPISSHFVWWIEFQSFREELRLHGFSEMECGQHFPSQYHTRTNFGVFRLVD